MSFFSWSLKKAVTSMMTTYFNARLSGDSHELALKTVVWRWCANSNARQDEMWYRFQSFRSVDSGFHYLSPGETEEDREMQRLVLCLLTADKGRLNSNTSEQIVSQILETYRSLKEHSA